MNQRLAASVCAVFASVSVLLAQDRPTFRAGTTLIELTIVALDNKGRPVTDLTRDDLVVTEQGQPREVVFFRFEGAPELRTRCSCAIGSPAAMARWTCRSARTNQSRSAFVFS